MGRFFNDPRIREEKMVVKFLEDGVLLSDMFLTGIVVACVNGTECYEAIPREDSQSRFLFYVKGDAGEIKQFIDFWFSGDKEKVSKIMKSRADELRRYGGIISGLKSVLDRARVKIEGIKSEVKNGSRQNNASKVEAGK